MNKYRSKLEGEIADILGDEWEYEPSRFPYTTHRKYTPDFVLDNTWIEVKGYFRVGDTAKYRAIRQSNPDVELVFVFSNPKKKVRKGAKLTLEQWAEKNDWISMSREQLREVVDDRQGVGTTDADDA